MLVVSLSNIDGKPLVEFMNSRKNVSFFAIFYLTHECNAKECKDKIWHFKMHYDMRLHIMVHTTEREGLRLNVARFNTTL